MGQSEPHVQLPQRLQSRSINQVLLWLLSILRITHSLTRDARGNNSNLLLAAVLHTQPSSGSGTDVLGGGNDYNEWVDISKEEDKDSNKSSHDPMVFGNCEPEDLNGQGLSNFIRPRCQMGRLW